MLDTTLPSTITPRLKWSDVEWIQVGVRKNIPHQKAAIPLVNWWVVSMTLNNLAAGWQTLFSGWAHTMFWYLKGYNPLTIHIITFLPHTFFYLVLSQSRSRSYGNGRDKKQNAFCTLSLYLARQHSENSEFHYFPCKVLAERLSFTGLGKRPNTLFQYHKLLF